MKVTQPQPYFENPVLMSACLSAIVQSGSAAPGALEQLQRYWSEANREVEQCPPSAVEFKAQLLPLARIKKVGVLQLSQLREPVAGTV